MPFYSENYSFYFVSLCKLTAIGIQYIFFIACELDQQGFRGKAFALGDDSLGVLWLLGLLRALSQVHLPPWHVNCGIVGLGERIPGKKMLFHISLGWQWQPQMQESSRKSPQGVMWAFQNSVLKCGNLRGCCGGLMLINVN